MKKTIRKVVLTAFVTSSVFAGSHVASADSDQAICLIFPFLCKNK